MPQLILRFPAFRATLVGTHPEIVLHHGEYFTAHLGKIKAQHLEIVAESNIMLTTLKRRARQCAGTVSLPEIIECIKIIPRRTAVVLNHR